ncbi:Peptidase family M1 domain protein [compost metagenome]
MFKAIRETLDYGSATFGAYPLKQFSMAEIPQYRGAATAYPGLIFSAERINFLSNHHLTGKIDQAYAITSHEVAHQWWANMLHPASVPGRPTLTESLAKYTENIRIEKTFGKMYLRKYMTLDNRLYFTAHNPEEKEESLSETNSESFVYYQKGGLIMYAIKEALGEESFNKVLKQLVENHRNPNRKATMEDFYKLLLVHAPESQKNFIRQSLMEVTTYSMAVKVLRCVALANGQYKIDLRLTAKLHVQGSAASRLSPDMDVDIAAFDVMPLEWADDTRPLFIQKYRLKQPVNEVSIIMNKKPKIIAIDPYQYLLDENKDDNVAEIK